MVLKVATLCELCEICVRGRVSGQEPGCMDEDILGRWSAERG